MADLTNIHSFIVSKSILIIPLSSLGVERTAISKETTKDNIPYQEIIDYFNKINKKNLKNVPSHQKFIRARWKEGYRLNDFKTVIDNKFLTWKGTEWEKYLRPSTLFGTKFDEYLNEINHNPINNNQKGVLNEYSKLKPKD